VELVERFAQQRENYLRAVEREVVELALAVAARILRGRRRWIRCC